MNKTIKVIVNELLKKGFKIYINKKGYTSYFYFIKDNNFYYIDDGAFGYNISSVYKPSTNHGTGSSILREATLKEVIDKIDHLPINYYIGGYIKKNPPVFYSTIKEFLDKSYFEKIEVTKDNILELII